MLKMKCQWNQFLLNQQIAAMRRQLETLNGLLTDA